MYGLLAALRILTRLPSPLRRDDRPDDVAASVAWFPVVGAGLGLALVAIDLGARQVVDPVVANALLIAFLAIITGAFHLDGLVDSVDGLSAGPDASARLATMRLAVVGAPGAVAACIILLADYTALAALGETVRTQALFLAPVCGRTAILVAYRLYPYARAGQTLSAQLKAGATTTSALIGIGFAVAACLIAAGPWGIALLALAFGVMHGVAALALARLPGLTGDVYGAICELSQLVVLLAVPFVPRI